MDVSMDVDSCPPAQVQSVRSCATCKITKLSVYSYYKNCPACRDKNRTKKRLQDEQKRQRKLLVQNLRDHHLDDEPESTTPLDYHDQNRRVSDPTGLAVPKTMVTTSVGVKRKAAKELHDLDKDEQRAALTVLKNGLKQTVKGNKHVVTPPRITNTSGEGQEYQTASAMYDVLKRKVAKASQKTESGKRLHFHGFHAIIAMPTIDNEKRVSVVVNDLRKIARVPFDHTKPSPSYNFETMARIVEYRCTCLGNDTTVVPPAPTPQPLAVPKTTMKGTDGDLIRQARQRAAMAASIVKTPRLCGGKVKITAVNDGRHPLGILAQRISISIEHPTPVAA